MNLWNIINVKITPKENKSLDFKSNTVTCYIFIWYRIEQQFLFDTFWSADKFMNIWFSTIVERKFEDINYCCVFELVEHNLYLENYELAE